jgi:hypothetical protein
MRRSNYTESEVAMMALYHQLFEGMGLRLSILFMVLAPALFGLGLGAVSLGLEALARRNGAGRRENPGSAPTDKLLLEPFKLGATGEFVHNRAMFPRRIDSDTSVST